jgi:hypothetical protein
MPLTQILVSLAFWPFMRVAASVNKGSLPPLAAFARQKKLADALRVRFLRAALSI